MALNFDAYIYHKEVHVSTLAFDSLCAVILLFRSICVLTVHGPDRVGIYLYCPIVRVRSGSFVEHKQIRCCSSVQAMEIKGKTLCQTLCEVTLVCLVFSLFSMLWRTHIFIHRVFNLHVYTWTYQLHSTWCETLKIVFIFVLKYLSFKCY